MGEWISRQLWFDVEERYNATRSQYLNRQMQLWFDVEERYNATCVETSEVLPGCGLM